MMVGPNDRFISEATADPSGRVLREIDPDRPILFLDVDGVVNALNREGTHAWDGAVITNAKNSIPGFDDRVWPIYASALLGEALLDLDVNIVWLTTWKYEANSSISPLCGLPEDLYVGDWTGTRRMSEGFQDWKTKVVLQFMEDYGGPFIWIDDEAIPGWFPEHLTDSGHEGNVLLVQTNSWAGLVPAEIAWIKSWLEEEHNHPW